MDEESRDKTGFVTQSGHYRFNVMSMGLKGSPANFQRLMARALGPLQYTHCLCYLDDVIVFSSTFEDHLSHLRSVFEAIKRSGLKLKASKCSLAVTRVAYLGHIVSSDGMEPNPAKVQAVSEWPPPSTVRELQSFLGLSSYYRRFIHNYSTIARPLTRLLQKDYGWRWEEEQENAFRLLKEKLTSAPILAFPDPSKPFILSTDASDTGIGAILKHLDDCGRERVIAYASRTLNRPETNYCTTEKECLAVVFGVQYFRHFLYGSPFTVVTDHCALCYLLTLRSPSGRLARWSLTLQDFDFTVVYKSGKKHTDVDALSRNPLAGSRDATAVSRSPGDSSSLPVLAAKRSQASADGDPTPVSPVPCLSRRKQRPQQQQRQPHRQQQPDRLPATAPAATVAASTLLSEGTSSLPSPSIDLKTLDLRHEQQSDPDLSPLIQALLDPQSVSPQLLHKCRRFLLQDGLLYRSVQTREQDLHQLCIPRRLRALVLFHTHDDVTAGHQGVRRTWCRVKERFYWPSMYRDVCSYVLSCESCGSIKTSRRRPPGFLCPLEPVSCPSPAFGSTLSVPSLVPRWATPT